MRVQLVIACILLPDVVVVNELFFLPVRRIRRVRAGLRVEVVQPLELHFDLEPPMRLRESLKLGRVTTLKCQAFGRRG